MMTATMQYYPPLEADAHLAHEPVEVRGVVIVQVRYAVAREA